MSPHHVQEAALAVNITLAAAILCVTARNRRKLRRIAVTERCILAAAARDIPPER